MPVNSAQGNPIIAAILPRMNGPTPVLLNPPVSYKGPFTFNATFGQDDLAAITRGMTAKKFLSLLKDGRIFVNVHTVQQPGGALQGILDCKGDCKPKLGVVY
ncbi:hypothetical protein PLESTB_001537000 [Pleodorina starrii]|uniref:CHRD domain-containing protein n=1 Tax=Pleodorina starrii TaxID=330485 RepID=A0A9W6BWZ1_9CHLO|nr:hypothetical protein PLESTM_001842200 [Pleodorina starrii]GLC59799.1 hypothetical protein PLESTB_001537000 [Pleodorina starrii]GLC67318.1 hypothetical protein PLESTF_000541800 [Pleodorina starrii]